MKAEKVQPAPPPQSDIQLTLSADQAHTLWALSHWNSSIPALFKGETRRYRTSTDALHLLDSLRSVLTAVVDTGL